MRAAQLCLVLCLVPAKVRGWRKMPLLQQPLSCTWPGARKGAGLAEEAAATFSVLYFAWSPLRAGLAEEALATRGAD